MHHHGESEGHLPAPGRHSAQVSSQVCLCICTYVYVHVYVYVYVYLYVYVYVYVSSPILGPSLTSSSCQLPPSPKS